MKTDAISEIEPKRVELSWFERWPQEWLLVVELYSCLIITGHVHDTQNHKPVVVYLIVITRSKTGRVSHGSPKLRSTLSPAPCHYSRLTPTKQSKLDDSESESEFESDTRYFFIRIRLEERPRGSVDTLVRVCRRGRGKSWERRVDGERGQRRRGAAAEGGERAEGARGAGFGRPVQWGRELLPQLRQGPDPPPLESPPGHPHQDIQVARPRDPWRPCYLVRPPSLPLSLTSPLDQRRVLDVVVVAAGTTRSCAPAAVIARYSTGMSPPAASSASFEATTVRWALVPPSTPLPGRIPPTSGIRVSCFCTDGQSSRIAPVWWVSWFGIRVSVVDEHCSVSGASKSRAARAH